MRRRHLHNMLRLSPYLSTPTLPVHLLAALDLLVVVVEVQVVLAAFLALVLVPGREMGVRMGLGRTTASSYDTDRIDLC